MKTRLRFPPHLLAALLAALLPAAARAQARTYPRVLVLIDTSGSMIYHMSDSTSAGGDGDVFSIYTDGTQANKNYYPGTNLGAAGFDGVNSRIYAAKGAWRDALYASGDFIPGLMHYPTGASCPTATYCCTPSSTLSGGCVCDPDYVNNLSTPAFCGGSAMGLITWVGGCGPINGSGQATAGGAVVSDPGSASTPAGTFANTLKWVDNAEDFRAASAGVPNNPELRAAGPSPIAGAARTALAWYNSIAAGGLDPHLNCRPYVFVYLTDAIDTCEVSPSNPATAPVAAVQALYNANAANPVKTYVVGVGPIAAADQAVLNNMAAAGGTGAAYFATGAAQARLDLADIVGRTIPYEKCDNLDNDCDGVIDNGYPDKGQTCAVGVGACLRTGIRKCNAAQTGTQCCVNDGFAACTPLSAGNPTAEVCNGVDDDCNGVIDDGANCTGQ